MSVLMSSRPSVHLSYCPPGYCPSVLVSFRPSVQSVPPSSRPSVLSPISGGQGVTIKRVLGSGEHRAQGAGLCAEYSEKCAGHKAEGAD